MVFPCQMTQKNFSGGGGEAVLGINQLLIISLFRKQDQRDDPWDEILNSARLG